MPRCNSGLMLAAYQGRRTTKSISTSAFTASPVTPTQARLHTGPSLHSGYSTSGKRRSWLVVRSRPSTLSSHRAAGGNFYLSVSTPNMFLNPKVRGK